jgi:chemotaxis response regulator CheB
MVGCVIRVALLHDEPTVLAALRRLIDRAPDLALVAAALNGESLVEQLRWMRPDVVVIGDPDGIVDGAPGSFLLSWKRSAASRRRQPNPSRTMP